MKAEVVDLLTAMGFAMRRLGDDRRAAAYLRSATAVARRADFDEILRSNRLREIPGVGESIERTIRRFAESGERSSVLLPEDFGPREAALPDVSDGLDPGPFPSAPDLHVHTTWSDGTLTLDETVAFAKVLGAGAIGISDHSGSLKIARGLDPDAVRAQWEEIERVQRAHPDFRILKGTECDILPDGSLDHPREILREFDYVIGSLHSRLRLPEPEQTARVLAALDQEFLTILGHPTTRVPGWRPRANLDLDAIFERAEDRGVAMEVNGNAGRIDLDAKLAKQALAAGCALALGSDAHSAAEMFALAEAGRIAKRAGATRSSFVNFRLLPSDIPAF